MSASRAGSTSDTGSCTAVGSSEVTQPGAEAVATRLSDILIVQAIRAWLAHDPTARDGWLQRMDCKAVGIAVWRLGAGRARKEDAISFGAGATVEAKVGDQVAAGDPVLVLHADDPDRFAGALAALDGAIDVGDERVERHPLVADRIS